ncbi:MAG: DUF1552 domain-containing protein [Bdellovibrionales bacterium]|nr:DUF1552 domain-containing protein [Bdellovibrionales bacterium]
MIYDPISRRMFLQGAGGILVSIPFLGSLFASEKIFAQSVPTVRFLAFFVGHGMVWEHWTPDPLAFDLKNVQGCTGIRGEKMSKFVGSGKATPQLSNTLHSAWNPYLDKMTMIMRTDLEGEVHNASSLMGAMSANRTTIDQIMARNLGVTAGTRVASITGMGAPNSFNAGNANNISIYQGNKVTAEWNPLVQYRKLFTWCPQTSTPSPAPTPTAPPPQAKAVDRIKEEFDRIRNNRRLSSADRQRLQEHMDLYNQIENRYASIPTTPPPTSGGTCLNRMENYQVKSEPSDPTNSSSPKMQVLYNQLAKLNSDQLLKDHMDIIALAVKTKATNISSFLFECHTQNKCGVTGLGGTSLFDNLDLHNNIGHQGNPSFSSTKAQSRRIYGDHLLRLVQSLEGEVEDTTTGATYLDNCLILWGGDQGVGHGGNLHMTRNQQVLLVGKAGGRLSSGRILDYGWVKYNSQGAVDKTQQFAGSAGNPNNSNFPNTTPYHHVYKQGGRPYNQVMVSLMNLMNISPSEFNKYSEFADGFGTYNYYKTGNFNASLESRGPNDAPQSGSVPGKGRNATLAGLSGEPLV